MVENSHSPENYKPSSEESRQLRQIEQYKAHSSFLTKLQAIYQALIASGYRPRTREEIDAQIRNERESWDE